jgi:hypothetical protein
MFTPQQVRHAFPEGKFRPAASLGAIAEAERLLGHELPPQIKSLYLEFDGFKGPTDAPFLFPVLERPGGRGESLVTYTLFFRGEGYFPAWVQDAVVLGDNGTGAAWFILLKEESQLVRWDAEWEEYEPVEGSLLDAWYKEKAMYESLHPDA